MTRIGKTLKVELMTEDEARSSLGTAGRYFEYRISTPPAIIGGTRTQSSKRTQDAGAALEYLKAGGIVRIYRVNGASLIKRIKIAKPQPARVARAPRQPSPNITAILTEIRGKLAEMKKDIAEIRAFLFKDNIYKVGEASGIFTGTGEGVKAELTTGGTK